MKFRATIRDDAYIREFVNILTTLAKMEKHIVFNLRENTLTLFICCEDFDTAPILWVDIEDNVYFSEFVFKRDPSEYEQIYFLIDSSKIMQTLTGVQKATNYFKMKLSSTPWECFVIQTEVPGQLSNHKKKIELPILIVSKRHWSEYQLPTNQTYDMTIKIPHLKYLCNVVSSMKNLSPEITLTIRASGSLILYVRQDEYKTRARLQDLTVINNLDPTDRSQDDENNEAVTICVVNSKRVAQILAHNSFRNASALISIKQDKLFRIDFEIRHKVTLHYLLPAMYRE